MFELSHLTTYQAGAFQSRAYRELKLIMHRILKPHGLTMMQWSVLGFVADAGKKGVRITTLAESLDSTQAFITNTVNTLEYKGFVERSVDKTDSRARKVALAAGKNKLVQKIELEVRAEMRKDIYSKVTPEQLQTYVYVLTKFANK
jgi:DNA-binding MarR family transcriptional regulator